MQNWSQYTFSILIVFGLLGLVLWWMRRNGFRRNDAGLGQRIQVQESLSLGPKHKMVLVQVDDQQLLIAISPSDVTTLHAWPIKSDSTSSTSSHHEA